MEPIRHDYQDLCKGENTKRFQISLFMGCYCNNKWIHILLFVYCVTFNRPAFVLQMRDILSAFKSAQKICPKPFPQAPLMSHDTWIQTNQRDGDAGRKKSQENTKSASIVQSRWTIWANTGWYRQEQEKDKLYIYISRMQMFLNESLEDYIMSSLKTVIHKLWKKKKKHACDTWIRSD